MKQAMKRTGSLLLAICMLITMLPVTAYAVEDEGSEELPVVNVSNQSELKVALESTTSSAIKLGGYIKLTEEVTMDTDHTLVIPEGKTLDITDAQPSQGQIKVNGQTLTINGGGIVNIKKNDGDGDGISDISNYFDDEYDGTVGTLMLENITVNIENTNDGGLAFLNITVGDKATINLNSDAASQISISHGHTLSIDKGGVVNINKFDDCGIVNYGSILINDGGELNISEGTGDNEGITNYGSIIINGGKLNISEGTGDNKSIANYSYYDYEEEKAYSALFELRSGGSLNSEEGGSIYLGEYTTVIGMNDKLSDRGMVLKADNVIVSNPYEKISEDGLTEGLYVWNGTVFSKEGINIIDCSPDYITITEGSITEGLTYELYVEGIASNGKPVTYQWYEFEEDDEGDSIAVEIEGATQNTFTIPDNLAAGYYRFFCELSAVGVGNGENMYYDVRVIPEGYYGLSVGGIEVTEDNYTNITGEMINGKVSYDPTNAILTLNNAEIAVIDNQTDEDFIGTAIDVYGGIENLTIKLKGSSQIGNEPANQDEGMDYAVLFGIYSYNKIIVKGSGSLMIYDYSQGITANDITIDTTGAITIIEHGGGAACCLKADGGTLEIKNGTLNLSSFVSNGLYGDTIKISGGTITAESFAQGSVKHYAFNTEPKFASVYKYKIYAGEDKDSAKEVTSPTPETFTQSKYVKIVPVSSGGGKDKDDDSGSPSGPAVPAVPTVPTPPTETTKKPVEQVLNDVGTHWALNSIQFVYDRGIMTGTSAEQFSPDAQMNRGMLITALGRLAGINALDFTSGSFNDVDMSSYYGPYAEWSLRSNITRGTGNNNFSPDNPVTREELAVILVNFANAMGYNLPSGEGAQSFADGSTISPWAMEAIEIMRNANIMQGDPSNNFNPQAPATRAEIAAVLQRFIEYMGL